MDCGGDAMSGFNEFDLPGLELCLHGERRKFCNRCDEIASMAVACARGEMPEALIEAECTRLLEQDGWRALRTDPVSDRGRGKGFGELGMADHLYIRYGKEDPTFCPREWLAASETLWIEFKSAKGKPKKHQIEWNTKERARGALTLIAGQDFPASVKGFQDWYAASGLMRRQPW
jgi:hypothetical protein